MLTHIPLTYCSNRKIKKFKERERMSKRERESMWDLKMMMMMCVRRGEG